MKVIKINASPRVGMCKPSLGHDMIVFSPTGTHEHNIRIHGGDVRLRSWLGFKKNIAVNCNGFVCEGVYPED